MQLFAKWFLAPALLYFIGFYLFNPHYWGQFTKGFFLDQGDGYQNVWNIWWIDWSVTQLHHHPWFTQYVHWPSGMSLIAQTLNPFNGFMVLPMLHLLHLSLVQVTNVIVLFSFVMSGVTMFWLVYYLNRSYVVALLAGAMFTFSSYHFGHALGHMQLISMEWMPLFLLAWWRLCERPAYRLAIGSGLALFLVMLCDYYYLFYSVLAAGIIAGYFLIKKDLAVTKQNARVFGIFVLTCLVTVVPFVYKLSHLNATDPLVGGHDAVAFSMDPFMAIIPGGAWHWSSITSTIWSKWPYASETNLYFGLTLIVPLMLIFLWRKRFTLPKWLNVWWIVFFTFAILALGPRLRIGTHTLDSVPLPYAGLTRLIPSLQVSGMPIRMVVMALLSGVVLASFAFRKINLQSRGGRWLFAVVAMLFVLEVYPIALPLSYPSHPSYVDVLRDLPQRSDTGIIDDGADSAPLALYYQTIHHKPLAFGYTTRTTTSVDHQDFHIFADIEQGRQGNLCSVYHIRYFVTQKYYSSGFPIIYQAPTSKVHIYDVKDGDQC